MNEIYAYPVIIQTWQKGQGAIMMSGTYDNAPALKWAKEQVLSWNNLYHPTQDQINQAQAELGEHRLWGLIKCGGLEDFGRPFLEIRAVLVAKLAILPSNQELQERLLALDLTQNLSPEHLSLPLARQPLPEPVVEPPMMQKIQTYTQKRVIPKVKENTKRVGNVFMRFGQWLYPKILDVAKTALEDIQYLWKNRRVLWESSKIRTQELRKHPDQIRPWLQTVVWHSVCEHKLKVGTWFCGIFVFFTILIFILWPSSAPIDIIPPTTVNTPQIEPINPDDIFKEAANLGNSQNNPTQPNPTADPTQPNPTANPTQPNPTANPTQPNPTANPTQPTTEPVAPNNPNS